MCPWTEERACAKVLRQNQNSPPHPPPPLRGKVESVSGTQRKPVCLVLVEFQKKQDRIKLRERERPDHAGPRRKAMWILSEM